MVMIDGQLVPPDGAVVSVFDRGFLYGDSVFETIRTYGGRPFELEKHLARLEQSAAHVLIDMPVSAMVLGREVVATVSASGFPEAYIRVMVTRGSGELGLAPASTLAPLRVVIVLPLHCPAPEVYSRGIDVVTYATQRAADATAAQGAKVANYLVSVLALHRAKETGALEALVVDGGGDIVEGATSNVFAVVRGVMVTPPEDTGILVGITRERVLEAARELSIPVDLRRLPLGDLVAAEEAFISSSVRELLPVVRVDGRPVGSGVPGPVTRRVHEQFRRNVWKYMGLTGTPPPLVPPGVAAPG